MILVRSRRGALYFLARDGEEAVEALRRSYPDRPLTVLKKADGLAILRIGESGTPGDDGDGDRLAIVGLVLPPAPPAFSFRA